MKTDVLFERDPRTVIKRLLLRDPSMPVADIARVLDRKRLHLSSLAIASVKFSFRQDLRVLESRGIFLVDWTRKEKRPALPVRDRNVSESEPGSENWDDRPCYERQPRPRSMSRQRLAIIQAIKDAGKPIGPTTLVRATGMRSANIRFLLHRMTRDGEVEKAGRGRYRLKRTK